MKASWNYRRIEEFAEVRLGKMLDRAKNRGKPRPYLRNLNVRWFEFALDDVLEMPFEDGEFDRYTARAGDLMVCEGGYPGRAAIWSGEPIYFQKAVHRVRCREPQRAKWLLYFLLLSDLDNSLKEHLTGTGIQHLTAQTFKQMKVPLPPLPEQQRIVAILDEAFQAIDTAAANTEKNFANARDMLNALIETIVRRSNDSWVTSKLGDVCTTQYGLSASMNNEKQGYKIFRMGEVQDGKMVDTGAMKHIAIGADEFEIYRLRDGDVLFNRTNSYDLVGKTGLFANLTGDYCFASYLVRVKFDPSVMNSRFAAYLINSPSFREAIRGKAARSVNQANINATVLRNETIRYPRSVAVQEDLAKTFAAASAEADRLADTYTRKLTLLAELRQSLLARAFAGELTASTALAA